MDIKIFRLGIYGTNSYLTWNDEKIGYLFDCGGENLESVSTFIEENKINLKYVIITHGHGDHIGGLNKLKELYPDVEVYIGKGEEEFLCSDNLNLMSFITGTTFQYNGKYKTVQDGDKIGEWEVFDTPGHTIGSKCFYFSNENILITGDTIFKESYGRYDLPTGSKEMLFNSLQKLCKLFPDETVIYSGHTGPTTIEHEKRYLHRENII